MRRHGLRWDKRLRMFLGIVWRRVDSRVPDRMDIRTAWDVAFGGYWSDLRPPKGRT